MHQAGRSQRRRIRLRWLLALVVALALLGTGGLVVKQFDTRGEHQVPTFLGGRGSWVEVFEDDFDGVSVDPEKWRTQRGGEDTGALPFNPGKEAAWFSPDNVTVENGMLALTIREDPATVDGRDYPLSSGVVETGRRFLVEPGSYVEARVQVPRCEGCWPAVWLAPPDVWPPEIDIVEWGNTGREERRRPMFNYITPSGEQMGPTEYGDPGRDYRGGFHTFGVLWLDDSAMPVLDGAPQPEVAATSDMTRLPMTLIANLSVKDGFRPAPGSRMLVDWIRVWRPAQSWSAADPIAGIPAQRTPPLAVAARGVVRRPRQ